MGPLTSYRPRSVGPVGVAVRGGIAPIQQWLEAWGWDFSNGPPVKRSLGALQLIIAQYRDSAWDSDMDEAEWYETILTHQPYPH